MAQIYAARRGAIAPYVPSAYVPLGTAYSDLTVYQHAFAGMTLDTTINDNNNGTGPVVGHSPPNVLTAFIDIGSDQTVTRIDTLTGWATTLVRDLEYSLAASPTVFHAIAMGAAPVGSGSYAEMAEALTGLSILMRYLRYSIQDSGGSVGLRELRVTL